MHPLSSCKRYALGVSPAHSLALHEICFINTGPRLRGYVIFSALYSSGAVELGLPSAKTHSLGVRP